MEEVVSAPISPSLGKKFSFYMQKHSEEQASGRN